MDSAGYVPDLTGRLILVDFGRDSRSRDSWRARRNFVSFCQVWATHDFTDFPSAKFHEICTQHVDRCRDESYFQNRIL